MAQGDGGPEDSKVLQQIAQEITGLRLQVNQLLRDTEDVVVGRVVNRATGVIRTMSFGVGVLILALAGWVGFNVPNGINWLNDMAKREATSATDHYFKQPETKNFVERTVKGRINELLARDVPSIASSIAVQQAAEVLNDVTQLRLQLAQRLKDQGLAPVPTSPEAFAIYGHLDPSGKWTVGPYFRPLRGDPKAYPRKDDQVEAIGNVFAHIGYSQPTPDRGWVNAPLSSLQVIHPRDKLLVLEAKNVHDGYIWIKFKILKRATK